VGRGPDDGVYSHHVAGLGISALVLGHDTPLYDATLGNVQSKVAFSTIWVRVYS